MTRRTFILVASTLFVLSVGTVRGQQIEAEPIGPDRWRIHTDHNQTLGTIVRTDTGNFRMYLPGGKYIGLLIRSTRKFRPARTTRHPLVSEAAARLYLATLEVMTSLTPSH